MKKMIMSLLGSIGLVSCNANEPKLVETSIYDFKMKTLSGKEKSLADYKGKVILIVNVASKCGLTPQYKDLEAIFEKYKDSGFMILGFPANNFLWQEPGTDKEISEFCQVNYGVTFDMFSKISVKGKDIHPLYQFLTKKEYSQIENAPVSWNFQKFLIDKNGKIIRSISPKTKVTEPEIIKEIESLL